MLDFLKNIDMSTWMLIIAGIYLILPANSPIKQFIGKILGPILGPIIGPQPTPVPGPTPTPVPLGPTPVPGPGPFPFPTPTPTPAPGLDWTTLMQLLLQVIFKAKNRGDTELEGAATVLYTHLENERKALKESTLSALLR